MSNRKRKLNFLEEFVSKVAKRNMSRATLGAMATTSKDTVTTTEANKGSSVSCEAAIAARCPDPKIEVQPELEVVDDSMFGEVKRNIGDMCLQVKPGGHFHVGKSSSGVTGLADMESISASFSGIFDDLKRIAERLTECSSTPACAPPVSNWKTQTNIVKEVHENKKNKNVHINSKAGVNFEVGREFDYFVNERKSYTERRYEELPRPALPISIGDVFLSKIFTKRFADATRRSRKTAVAPKPAPAPAAAHHPANASECTECVSSTVSLTIASIMNIVGCLEKLCNGCCEHQMALMSDHC